MVENIIVEIADMSLKTGLAYLATKGITDFLDPKYERVKNWVTKKYNEGRYAFVPDRNEALFLQSVGMNPKYKELRLLVPNYKYLDLIRTGFLIDEYNEKVKSGLNESDYKKRVGWIKKSILNRPGGPRLLKIAKLVGTQFFSAILKYLHDLKIHGYAEEHLEEEFNSLVEDWEKSSRFVKGNQQYSEIVAFCRDQVEKGKERFFVLALYDQIKKAEKAMEILDKELFFKLHNYNKKMIREGNDELPILEIIIFKRLTD